jgi:molybdenum cofactor cytidylyltransferase
MEMKPRHFALIPAAGHSSRMGQPKLLLPLAGQPLIVHTLRAWQRSGVDRIVVVIRPGDQRLAEIVRRAGAEVVIPPLPPPDMRASLEAALRHIDEHHAPTAGDAFLVAPADMPRLSPAIIDRLIDHHVSSSMGQIVVPTIAGRQGHPVLFPWSLAAEVYALKAEEGLNSLVARRQPTPLPCEDLVAAGEHPFADIDTPDEYEQMTDDQ